MDLAQANLSRVWFAGWSRDGRVITYWPVLDLPIGLALLAYAVREWKARDARIAKANRIFPANGVNRFNLTVVPVFLAIIAAFFILGGLVAAIRYAV